MQTKAPMFKTMLDQTENARAIAREEITALKKDLTVLERILSGRKKADDFSLIDVAHGAFEIFRTASVVLENEKLLAEMQDAVDMSLAEQFLTDNGATLLKDPEGWHWISPKGVMRHLGTSEETVTAAKKLKRYLPRTPQKQPPAPSDEN